MSSSQCISESELKRLSGYNGPDHDFYAARATPKESSCVNPAGTVFAPVMVSLVVCSNEKGGLNKSVTFGEWRIQISPIMLVVHTTQLQIECSENLIAFNFWVLTKCGLLKKWYWW